MQCDAVGNTTADTAMGGNVNASRVGGKEVEKGQDGFSPQHGFWSDLLHGEGVGWCFAGKGKGNGQAVDAAADVLQASAVGKQGQGIGGETQFPCPCGGHEAVPVNGVFIDGLVGGHGRTLSKMKVFCQEGEKKSSRKKTTKGCQILAG